MRRAAVTQVIAINGGDHRMREIEVPHGFGDVAWFSRVKLAWLTLANRAETTMPGADITTQHKSSRPVSPAFEDIGAPCFLANGVQIQALDQLEQVVLVSRIAQTNTQPLWLWLTRFVVENLEFAGQSVYLSAMEDILASVC